MYEWVELSDQLRDVREAFQNFAIRGAIEQWIIGPMLLDRLAEDLTNNCQGPKLQQPAWKVDGRDGRQ